jgi:uronate dehydrogenase
MRVLITGAGGYIGRRLTPGLEGAFDLRLGDIAPLDDRRFVPLDVTDPAAARRAAQGVDAVVHLAIASGQEGDYEDDAFNQKRFAVNVWGTWNMLQAAREAGARRFVFTSSLMVVWGYAPPAWVAADAPARPVGTYAVTKHLGEVMCQQTASHGMSVICLRIPKPIDLGEVRFRQRPIRPQWLAFPDLIQAYRLALTAPAVEFATMTIVGESSRRRWDLSKAERVLQYRPSIRLEELGYQLGSESEPL